MQSFCAHSIPGFSSENILSITTPEVLRDFGFRVASPFLEKEPMKAFEYLKSLIESVENEWQFPKRRHRPPPLPVGPPDDNNILLFSSTQAFRIERKVDRLYPKLAELSALLSSGELAHSPAGWVTLNTLNAYTGRAVPGNFDPQSQTVVDSKPFTLTHQSTPLKLDDQLLQAIVAIDDKNRQRFQIGSHSVSGRKELVIRLTPSAPRSWIGAAPPQSSATYIPPSTLRPTSPYAAYFCLPHMIQVLTKAGINPRRRGHNAFWLYAAWVRSRAERPSVSYTKVVMEVARTGHNLHLQKRINQQNCGSNKFLHRGGREDETDARAEHQTHCRGASNEWMKESGFRCSAGHQTHWQDASKGGVQKRACVDLRGRLGARK